MHSFREMATLFAGQFAQLTDFKGQPSRLYEPCDYFLQLGGKRIRPVLCLMAHELFEEVNDEVMALANAVELFHNFTLIHDDMMDAAPMRRGLPTVHQRNGHNVALLAGDVMMIAAYQHLAKLGAEHLHSIMPLFNRTAREVCEGQQLDMDFETQERVSLDEYVNMIALKTSVLLAACLQMGAHTGGASEGSCKHLYAFGRELGIAFQIQDDYLDAFGDEKTFGKEIGGDIRQNKKTFLYLRTQETANAAQAQRFSDLLAANGKEKYEGMIALYKECGADAWALELKEKYYQSALRHLDEVAVVKARKKHLLELAQYLLEREV